ncbi:NYN domain-containing protein [Aliirhizobium terrae]|uniref:NYN domain-containing protein n=1 Tax=Terrirhizobium terrae TaxID=2926709 RepID=UPI0025775516|nr:NYN domain-containing protein [Rhizobium sp. CC-CFT758]WJH40144.1 NYN domain-containing protein [Rhizobium sp. CC-CFT758]
MAVVGSKVGVFIDAENLPPRVIQRVLDIAASCGPIVERRVYGDFTREMLRPWVDVASRHALSLQTAQVTISGKNSSDILLAIDVTEMMCKSEIGTYCIISNDSDFIHLATRLRMRGNRAVGIGGSKASSGLRVAFDEFFDLDLEKMAEAKVVTLKRTKDIRPYVIKALAILGKDAGEWVKVGHLASAIRQANPGFQTKSFGFVKFSTVLKKSESLEIRNEGTVDMEVRVRSSAGAIVQTKDKTG